MRIAKLTMLTGIAVISVSAAAPTNATWYTYNGGSIGGWSTSGGWGSSGWGSSGWGSSGWGSSSYGGTTSTSSSSTSGSSTSTSSSSSSGSSAGGTPVPEPSNMVMLALGVAGLVAGRMAARKKRKKM